jgi:hypothetical protein
MTTRTERMEFARKRNRRNKKLEKAKKHPNGRSIQDFMFLQNIKGDYRNYVVLNQDTMMDYRSTYNIEYTNSPDFDDDDIFLIHKKELHKLIGERSRDFWHPVIGRIVDVPRTKGKKDL